MPLHRCLDPQDPYAEREVVVAYDRHAVGLLLRAALNEDGDDILPDLADAQLADLRYEIEQARPARRSADGSAAGRWGAHP